MGGGLGGWWEEVVLVGFLVFLVWFCVVVLRVVWVLWLGGGGLVFWGRTGFRPPGLCSLSSLIIARHEVIHHLVVRRCLADGIRQ